MCGIVGYIGKEEALGYLIDSLRVLEYRGYDSAGVALLDNQKRIQIKKSKGKLGNLINLTDNATDLHGSVGIGHTRWATQGIPSDINAHPHSNTDTSVVIVHNGIINNYLELKEDLIKNYKIAFTSETDSEIVAHLIGVFQNQGLSLKDSLIKTIERLKGSYALAIICKQEPDKIFLACNEAPLIIGIGNNQDLFCASDSSALLQYTNKIIRLKDLELAELGRNGEYKLYDLHSKEIKNPEIQILTGDPLLLDKAGFKHYLLKEIHEQPSIIRKLLSSHLDEDLNIQFPEVDSQILKDIDRIIILGCGTAYYAGMVGKILLETLSHIPTEIEFSSELLARPVLANEKTLLIAISQSGETADTLLAVKSAIQKGARILAVTNRPESSLASLAKKSTVLIQAGVEVSVAATKSFTSQMFCLYLLAIKLAELRSDKKLSAANKEELNWIKGELRYIPQIMEQALSRAEIYRSKILPFAGRHAFIFLGRGVNYPIALEGALKLKEITYMQATGYAAGEMKHGPIATIDENIPTLSILLPGPTYHKTLHNCIEAKTRGAPSLGIVADGDNEAIRELDVIFPVPQMPSSGEIKALGHKQFEDILSPFISVIPLQLIAYYLAEYMGKDVDQPRNLAKSVTVE
jgi:glucosamine--fructose-6-phosphate aminotransferase (isomerizing)